jgi:uncharacterized protein YjbI with pentapeptide repeats
MAEKLDPYDVAALERSLNDSATRVSTIWVSFLIFSLYLLTAATTVTQRQLFLAAPLKLPVLNIDLPVWGFFFLAPILFVILHIYVLLQVLLLGRTAAAYDRAFATVARREGLTSEGEASVRQRLANTLFAQIFAGSPREREGWLGFLLKAMAWITLAIAPILVLVVFQFSFLPYHSHIATWTHRVLILLELLVFFLIWPLTLDARREFEWPNVWRRFKRLVALPQWAFGPKDGRHDEWLWLREQAMPLAACLLYVLVPLSLATFPGEWHVNLFTLHWPSDVQCDRWMQQRFRSADLRFDRLILPNVDAVDDEKLSKIQDSTKKAAQRDYEGERTQKFSDRNLKCGIFISADVRRADFSGAQLQGAILNEAQLQGADLIDAQLQGAYLAGAKLQGASLIEAHLQGASLNGAQLQGAYLVGGQLQGALLVGAQLQGASLLNAQLQGASLFYAQLQGADLSNAHLQGASLNEAQLQGASLFYAQLQGASLSDAQLQGASLQNAQLQGADLIDAQLQGASLAGASLQGANLNRSSMTFARLSRTYVWRARNPAACRESRVVDHKSEPTVTSDDEPPTATPDWIAKFIEAPVADIPDGHRKELVRARMQAGLVVDPSKDDTAAIERVWAMCEEVSAKPSREEFDRTFDEGHADFLRKLVCEDTQSGRTVVQGIIPLLSG